MKATKARTQNRFMRIITIPIRALGKARDLYVRSMNNNAERLGYGSSISTSTAAVLPRSFSHRPPRSGGEDYAELVRAASARSYGDAVIVSGGKPAAVAARKATVKGVSFAKCSSVGMGRIEEDKACDFDEDVGGVRTDLFYPRSRSCAVAKRRVV